MAKHGKRYNTALAYIEQDSAYSAQDGVIAKMINHTYNFHCLSVCNDSTIITIRNSTKPMTKTRGVHVSYIIMHVN